MMTYKSPMEMKGIEPSFPRCDRGVLPLHHIPGITFCDDILPKHIHKSTGFCGVPAKKTQNFHFSKLTIVSIGSRFGSGLLSAG